jgi:sucrose-6-phosphate hydrolase SacC (GH32 family)
MKCSPLFIATILIGNLIGYVAYADDAIATETSVSDAKGNSLQYFKPEDPYFVGDCMPFFLDGIFHFYYLRDENHHHGKNGLGGHQWAHASSRDLIHWEHHPMAISITEDREASICTGSVFYHDGVYRGYYATRMMDGKEHLSVAVSSDGITFQKTEPNPFASPETGYVPGPYRDPCVFLDERSGLFHLIATACLEKPDLDGRGGCLAQLVSTDLKNWKLIEPFYVPGCRAVPECPDHFEWNGWHYLVFSIDGIARYRMSRDPLGPWARPKADTFCGPMERVMKTAAFTGNRRIGVAFLPTLDGNKDSGGWQYAGNAVFHEIVQNPDGTLGSKFPEEMTPATGDPISLEFVALSPNVSGDSSHIQAKLSPGMNAAALQGCPKNARIAFTAKAASNTAAFGVCLRGSGKYEQGYELRFTPYERKVDLRRADAGSCFDNAGHALTDVQGLDGEIKVDIYLVNDIIDVCVNNQRCMANRFMDFNGDRLFFFAQDGGAEFSDITVKPLNP